MSQQLHCTRGLVVITHRILTKSDMLVTITIVILLTEEQSTMLCHMLSHAISK